MKRLRSIILVVTAMVCTTITAQQKVLDELVYWFDHDISASKPLGESGSTIDVSTLSKGLHTFTIRVKDNTGLWSSTVTKYFLIPRPEETGVCIVRYMYWFDDDIDNGVVVETNGTNDIVNVEVGGLSEGKHTLYWRVGDSTGKWSQRVNHSMFNYILPETGIGAFSSDIQLALHDDLQAGYCTEYDAANERIQVAELTTIPANTGVLLHIAGGGSVAVPVAEATTAITDNCFVGTLTDITSLATADGNYKNYILNNKNGNVGFYWANGQKVGAHRAYAHVLTSNLGSTQSFISINPGEESGIENVCNSAAEDNVYDLQGRRVAQPQKGLYIVSGKKVIIK